MAKGLAIAVGAAALLVALGLGSGQILPSAQADDAAADIKARSQLMKDNAKAVKAMLPMFKGEVDYDAEVIRQSAALIQSHGGSELTKLFPEGSVGPNSYALPAIWQDWHTFAALADDLVLYSEGLVAAAGNPRTGGESSSQGTLGQSTLGQTAQPSVPRDPEALAKLSPDVVFQALGNTCNTCHTKFRKEDN